MGGFTRLLHEGAHDDLEAEVGPLGDGGGRRRGADHDGEEGRGRRGGELQADSRSMEGLCEGEEGHGAQVRRPSQAVNLV